MKYNINLLQKRSKGGFLDKLIYFFLHYLRYALVITQLIVIIVFFLRFRVDQSIVDLEDAIDQKKEIVKVAQPLIAQAHLLDSQISHSKSIIGEQNKLLHSVDYIMSVFPKNSNLIELSIENNLIRLTGTTQDVREFQSFYALLKKEAKFKVIDLSDINRKESGYSFNLKLENFIDKK